MERINQDAKNSSKERNEQLLEMSTDDNNVEGSLYNSFKCTFSPAFLKQIDVSINTCQVLILASTREIAKEIQQVIKELVDTTHINCQACYGGTNVRDDQRNLETACHIVVGTAGRILDMINRKALQTNKINTFVLYESEKFIIKSSYVEQMLNLIATLPSDASVIILPDNRTIELTTLRNDFETTKLEKNEFRTVSLKCAFTSTPFEQIDISINTCQILILTSTRKLANQIQQVIKELVGTTNINCHACYGGTNIHEETRNLGSACHILVGTLGCVLDMINHKALQTNKINIFVLYKFKKFTNSSYVKKMLNLIATLPSDASVMFLPENRIIELTNLKNDFEANISATVAKENAKLKKNKSRAENVSRNENKEATGGQLEPTDCQTFEGDSFKCFFSPALLEKIDASINACQVLILASTRKLAKEIQQVIKELVDTTNIKCHACYGGTNIHDNKLNLETACHIVVGTPVFILDMINRKVLQTNKINIIGLNKCKTSTFKKPMLNLIATLPFDASVFLIPENRYIELTNLKSDLEAEISKKVEEHNAKLMTNDSITESFKCAFSPALLEKINVSINACQVLILAPTHKYIKRIQNVVKEFADPMKFNCHAYYGDTNICEENQNSESACHIVVGTPDRVLDMINRKALQTNKINIFVLHEFKKFTNSFLEKQMLKLIAELPSDASVVILPENRTIELTNFKNDFEAAKLREDNSRTETLNCAFSPALLKKIDILINTCQILVLTSTRYLAQEIQQVIKVLVGTTNINCHACYGGTNVRDEQRNLKTACHIVVGTPGRVLDMINRKALQTNKINTFVLHESGKLINSSFMKEMLNLIAALPSDVSVILLPENRCIKLTNLENDFETVKSFGKDTKNYSKTDYVSRNEIKEANGGQLESLDCKTFEKQLVLEDNAIENSFINYIRSTGIMQQIEVPNNSCQVLILASTRELVMKIQQIVKKFIFSMKLDGHIYVGDTNIREEIRNLEAGFHIIVDTPDRVYDIKALNFCLIKHIIIYEFPKCLSSTYQDQMHCVINSLPANVRVFLLPENLSSNLMDIKKNFNLLESTESESTIDVTNQMNNSTNKEDVQSRYAKASEAIAKPSTN